MSLVRPAMLAPRDHAPTRSVSRGAGAPSPLPIGRSFDVDSIDFEHDGVTSTVGTFLDWLDNDSMIVVRAGEVIHESYRHGGPDTLHQLASMSKSVVGLVAAAMIADGELDPSDTMAHHCPSFAGCAYGDTTLAHLLDMRTKIVYDGRPYDQLAEASRFFAVVGLAPKEQGVEYPADIRAWMCTSGHEVEPGTTWRYENGNTEAVAEALTAVTGLTTSELVSRRLWSQIGAEHDGAWFVDASGREMASGGLSVSLRDLARFGELLRNDGVVGGRRVVGAEVVRSLRDGADPDAGVQLAASDFGPELPGWGYHRFWWLPPRERTLLASGRFGQHLYVSPEQGVTIALLSSATLLGFKMYGRRLTAMLERICDEVTR